MHTIFARLVVPVAGEGDVRKRDGVQTLERCLVNAVRNAAKTRNKHAPIPGGNGGDAVGREKVFLRYPFG